MVSGTGCSKYFVFDVELTDDYKYSEMWVDKYKYGEKTEKIIQLGLPLNIQNKSPFIMLTVHNVNNENEKWVLSGNGMSGLPMDFFTNKEQHLEELKENNYAYILKIRFYKETPYQ